MSQLSSANYDLSIASLEIILLLAAAFLGGALLCYLLRLSGLCCRRKKVVSGNESLLPPDSYQPEPDGSAPAHRATPKPTISTGGGSYEAEIGSLIRSNGESQTRVMPARRTPPVVNTLSATPSSSITSSFEERAKASLAGLHNTQQKTTGSIDYTLDIPVPDDDHVDDLKKLEGIGPAIEELLNEAGIRSYAKLATMDRDYLKGLLEDGGKEFGMHEPKSWPYQAELAAKNNWGRLKEYQDFLLADRK